MEVLYTRYNYHRRPEFQTATSIVVEGGQRRVYKRALTPAAQAHLQHMLQMQARFAASVLPGGFEAVPLQAAGAAALVCDYMPERSLNDLLFEAFQARDQARFWAELDDYVRRLRTGFQTIAGPAPAARAELTRVFGRADFSCLPAARRIYLALSAIDLIFANVLVVGERRLVVDNEWVFAGGLPADYVLYRALFEFYEVQWKDFGIERFVPLASAAQRYGLDAQALAMYREMEESFQIHVFGRQRLNFYGRFMKLAAPVPRRPELIAPQAQAWQAWQDLRVQAETLAAIRASYSYRLSQAVCRGLDRLLPPASRRRRWLVALARAVMRAGARGWRRLKRR